MTVSIEWGVVCVGVLIIRALDYVGSTVGPVLFTKSHLVLDMCVWLRCKDVLLLQQTTG